MNGNIKKRVEKPVIPKIAILLAGIMFGSGFLYQDNVAYGQANDPTRSCPYVLNLGDPNVTVEIDRIVFTDTVLGVDGNGMVIQPEQRDLYRLAVTTLKITKPAGRHLSVAACDLTLHYFYGEDTEAAPCEGISTLTETREADRPVKLPTVSGPGFVKMTTGVRATQASVVYMDAVFAYVEPNVRECWICVAQPTTTAPYVCPSPAWSN